MKLNTYIDMADKYFEQEIEKLNKAHDELKRESEVVVDVITLHDINEERSNIRKGIDFYRMVRTLLMELRAYRRVERLIAAEAKADKESDYNKVLKWIDDAMKKEGVVFKRDDFDRNERIWVVDE